MHQCDHTLPKRKFCQGHTLSHLQSGTRWLSRRIANRSAFPLFIKHLTSFSNFFALFLYLPSYKIIISSDECVFQYKLRSFIIHGMSDELITNTKIIMSLATWMINLQWLQEIATPDGRLIIRWPSIISIVRLLIAYWTFNFL